MDSVVLESVDSDHGEIYHYVGARFQLDSSADAQVTRRCIVRLEQMFRAFRQVLPERREADAKRLLRIRLFGTNDSYYQYLREQGIPIRNPAYFDATRNEVVAGSDVRRFAEELAGVRRHHQQLLREQERLDRKWPRMKKELVDGLQAEGVDAAQRRRIVAAAQQRWEKQKAELKSRISTANRKNNTLLDDIVRRMLARLYHEAFHAYLENYVYDSQQHQVPRWLNEGLAQIFETGLLEADTLRIDSPTPEALLRLKKDLASKHPLSLAELLSADQTVFLVPHRRVANASDRHYLYSWGLAYYLTFRKLLLGTDVLDGYVSRRAGRFPPTDRFERLVGMPLDEFERQWRKHMLSL